jgi:transposase
MLKDRFVIGDEQWALMDPHCLGKKSDPGRSSRDARIFREGVLWIARTGASWRDFPLEFGNLIDFKLMPGQAHELVMTRELLADVCCQSLLVLSRRMLHIQLPGNGQGL